MLPVPVAELCKPIQPTVPQVAVAVAKVTSASVATVLVVAVGKDEATLAYEPPVTSVPVSASVGLEVHSDTNGLSTGVKAAPFSVELSKASSSFLLQQFQNLL